MAQQRPALGRGLGALLGDATGLEQKPAQKNQLSQTTMSSEIPLNQITPNPYQPRITFDEDALQELATSIRNIGIIQPITLRRTGPGRYQIISGERRFRAAKLAGLETVPAFVREADDNAMLEMAIVENIQRENLDAIETALSYQRLIEECRLTQEEMADRVGKKRATVTNFLRLLRLPVEIQKELKYGTISVGHAKALLSLNDEKSQLSVCAQAVEGGWSVRQIEEKVKKMLEPKPESKPEPAPLPERFTLAKEIMGKYFDGNVSVKPAGKNGGTISVRFSSDEQLEAFIRIIDNRDN